MSPAEIGAAAVPRISAAVHSVELDGEAVLLDEAADRLHHFNPTATLVWSSIDGHATAGEIAAGLAQELGADAAVVLADVIDILRTFRAEGLLADLAP